MSLLSDIYDKDVSDKDSLSDEKVLENSNYMWLGYVYKRILT